MELFNPIQDGPFLGCSWMGGGQTSPTPHTKSPPLPKVCQAYPTIM